MITKYQDFIVEKKDIEPKDFQIDDYWDALLGTDMYLLIDGKIDVNCWVDLSYQKLTKFPFDFGKVDGFFRCDNNKLTTLKGCPTEVNGYFKCFANKLTSLEYCPKFVNGDFVYKSNLSYIKDNLLCIEDYPLCIINGTITISDDMEFFEEICKIVKENEEIFSHLLDDKIKFHQMLMRLKPSLIPYYKNIPPPNKKTTLML